MTREEKLAKATHGTGTCYTYGCRCLECTSAKRNADRDRRKQKLDGTYKGAANRTLHPTHLDERLARFVGAFLGDGWIRQSRCGISGYCFGLAIGEFSEPHTLRYKDLCEGLFPGYTWKVGAPGAFGLSGSSKSIHSWLVSKELGFESPKRFIPEVFKGESRELKLSLLAGMIDADGSVSQNEKNKGRIMLCLSSEELTKGCHSLALECGLEPTQIRPYNGEGNFGPIKAFRFAIKSTTANQIPLWHENKLNRLRAND